MTIKIKMSNERWQLIIILKNIKIKISNFFKDNTKWVRFFYFHTKHVCYTADRFTLEIRYADMQFVNYIFWQHLPTVTLLEHIK